MSKKILAVQLLESVVLAAHPTLQTAVNVAPLFLRLIAQTQTRCQYFMLIREILSTRGVYETWN